MFRSLRSLAFLIVVHSCLIAQESVDFARNVQPILSDHCFHCHGPDEAERQADLRLDTQDGLLGMVEIGDADSSEIFRRITSDDPEEMMPPPSADGRPTSGDVAILSRWIKEGAVWQPHWAFAPVKRPIVPRVVGSGWPVNSIDHFVLHRMRTAGLTASEEADRPTLIRRVYLDMLGLVPSEKQVTRFVRDQSPEAYVRLIDDVLANPHYGERWGRHWLDQARYADSDGYSIDGTRDMWPYRDWVIAALNADQPFDQFTIEQLAGDLLPEPTIPQLVATGFHRNTLVNQEGGSDPEQFRNEAVVDRVNTTGAVWLGLTIGCAQCHTHKFDPITQEDYYGLFAFFNSGEDKNSHDPRIVPAPPEVRERLAELRTRVAEMKQALKRLKETKSDQVKVAQESIQQREREIREIRARYGSAMIMSDLKQPRDTFVLVRGDFLRPAEKVQPMVPSVLADTATEFGTRLDLARWLVDEKNPLTSRVAVNRIWMQLFGHGIVETENDFGIRGTQPTHPDLLDWLAAEFMDSGWSLKRLHRLILLSATYRQASFVREGDLERDPANRWLARQSRLRVSAEIVRDLFLSASGILTDRIGGPSVFPPQPEGVYAFTQNKKQWKVSEGESRFRRGMYTFFFRSAPHPFLTTFDSPNFQVTCTQRVRSNTPLQSLTMANDESMLAAARALAKHVLVDADGNTDRIRLAFVRCLARDPSPRESRRLESFLNRQGDAFRRDTTKAEALLGSEWRIEKVARADAAAWVATCRVVMNLDEFVVRN